MDIATGRWIAEEILDPDWDGETYGVFLPCATEKIARQIARYADEVGKWKVNVYPEMTVTGIMDGRFSTADSAEKAFVSLFQYVNWAEEGTPKNTAAANAWEDAHGVRRENRAN